MNRSFPPLDSGVVPTPTTQDLPSFEILGTLDELTLEGGANNDDGWGHSQNAIDIG